MKDIIKPVSKTLHDKMVEMKCCGDKVKYNQRIDNLIKGVVDTYWCPVCGFSFTMTAGYIDDDEMPST